MISSTPSSRARAASAPAADAAIDGDQHLGSFGRQFADRLAVEPVALVDAVRDVIAHLGASSSGTARGWRCRSCRQRRSRRRRQSAARRKGRRRCARPPTGSPARARDRAGPRAWDRENRPRPAGSVSPRQISNCATTAGMPAACSNAAMRSGIVRVDVPALGHGLGFVP